MNGDFTLSLLESQGDYKNSSASLTGSGETLFSLYPTSRFPFTATLGLKSSERRRSFGENDSLTTLSLGLEQRYRTLGHDIYQGELYAETNDSRNDGIEQRYRLALSADNSWSEHHALKSSYNFTRRDSSRLKVADRRGLIEQTDTSRFFSRYRFNPQASFSNESFLSLFDEEQRYANRTRTERDWQQNNSLLWRPLKYKRWRLSGFGRLATREVDTSDGGGAKRDTLDLGTGVSYDYSTALRFDGQLSVGGRRDNEQTYATHNERLGVSYRPVAIRWRTYDYNRFARASVRNSREEDGSSQQLAGSLGHALTREFNFSFAEDTRMQFDQQFASNFDSRADSTDDKSVIHRVSLTFRRVEPGVSSFLRTSVEDQRAFDVLEADIKEAQRYYLQVNRTSTLSRYRNWEADMTLEYLDELRESGENISRSYARGYVSYVDNRLLNVRSLSFRSSLRLNKKYETRSGGRDQNLFDDEDEYEASWENRLTYRVGRLELNSDLTAFKRDGGEDYRFNVRARRYFGDF
ncbi:hypothetical protein D0544_09415 [Aestuariirhabdus litorea]|uniref:Uncharacterized protein n=2 Tax=Aestuariirhabdus litorea TaxID=2528527 RepID=A0A3P3VRK5_9GAMM|nr:hypothetical protein D0544_09415 [Aestuariirhabdus litorea]